VRFAYRPDKPVIRGMSFVAEPGKVTALVGQSGGGKSTVLNLLLRFYDADSGTSTIDGHDISLLPRRALRRQIGYVGQHVHLFRGTIRDNIVFGKPGASDAEIIAAARAAHAHDFIATTSCCARAAATLRSIVHNSRHHPSFPHCRAPAYRRVRIDRNKIGWSTGAMA
jgi:ABC-type multidrug transport system fused ATPase/permease subunit